MRDTVVLKQSIRKDNNQKEARSEKVEQEAQWELMMALPASWFIIATSIKFTWNLKSNIFSLQDSKFEWGSHKQHGNDTFQGRVTSPLTLPNWLFSLVQCVETYRKHIILLYMVLIYFGGLKSVIWNELRKYWHYPCYNQAIEIQYWTYMKLEELLS